MKPPPAVNCGGVLPAHCRKCRVGTGGVCTAVGCRSSEHPTANRTTASGIRARRRNIRFSECMGVLPGHGIVREMLQQPDDVLIRLAPGVLPTLDIGRQVPLDA